MAVFCFFSILFNLSCLFNDVKLRYSPYFFFPLLLTYSHVTYTLHIHIFSSVIDYYLSKYHVTELPELLYNFYLIQYPWACYHLAINMSTVALKHRICKFSKSR